MQKVLVSGWDGALEFTGATPAMAQDGCSYGWAAQVFKCFAEHGKSSPLVAGAPSAPVEVQPAELLLAFQMQQLAAFDAVPLDLGLAFAQA